MNTQPKPAGEWSSQIAYDLYRKDDGGFMAIAEAHNAALAAEREQHNKELREYESALSDTHLSRIKVLEQQLDAEREKVHAYEGALIKIANDPNCDRCQVAVDALAKIGEK